jgi:RNA polymerase sigma-70 factor (ECF subfamily)
MDSIDDGLVARAMGGDPDAFRQLVGELGRFVYAICRRRSPTAEDARDAAQQTWLKVWRNRARFDGRSIFRWLFVIAHRACRDAARARRGADPLDADRPGAEPPPAEAAEHREGLRELITELKGLDERDRQVLIARFWHEREHADIARDLGVNAAYARKLLERALDRLAHLLGEDPP